MIRFPTTWSQHSGSSLAGERASLCFADVHRADDKLRGVYMALWSLWGLAFLLPCAIYVL